ncbi:MAG TPA: hypothetical protein VM658_21490 [bacterium]|nr:hypothetical protein [bacterium]
MNKAGNRRSWSVALGLMAGVFLVSAAAGPGPGKPRPRVTDLVNTVVRNALVGVTMDAIPKPMLDPALDDGATFSYFARPSFQIGIRGEPRATQVTDNGHLWTGAAEWLALAGDPLAPANQRIYTLYKGYLPCITYTVESGGVAYTVRAFQYWLDGDSFGQSPPVNFIRITAENPGDKEAQARFAGGFMYGPRDHRSQQMRQMNFNAFWNYEMTERAATRGGKIIYAWGKKPDTLESRAGKAYRKAFVGAGREEPVCLAVYKRTLGPGESFSADFAMPHYPADAVMAQRLAGADFDERLAAMESYWEGWLGRGAHFKVAERKVNDASRAYVIHSLMSQNVISDDEVEQHVNRFQYNRFWLRDSSFYVSLYETWGYPEVGRALARHFYPYQRDDGNFLSQRGQLDGWGQSMWALGTVVRYTGDVEFAKDAVPRVEAAVGWLDTALTNDAWGLMPPTDAFDNETITGRYTGHNFWALTGLDAAIDLCRAAGRDDLAEKYAELRGRYYDRFMTRLGEVAAQRDGVIPPGLDVPGGTEWGNLLAVYPGHIIAPFDPLVTATFEHYRRDRMQEGIGMWHQSLHHYLTERVAQTMLIRGEQERALDDFYGMLLHTGACHEGFEWAIFAWDGRDYCQGVGKVQTCNFPPHGWYAADFDLLLRNMLIREDGKELHLASALSPEWTKPGDRITVENAPTWFGPVSYELSFSETSATLDLTGYWRNAPDSVTFHVPYFLKLTSAAVDGKPVARSGGAISMPAGSRKLTIEFERLAVEPKSYAAAVDRYKKEYRRRWEERGR